MLAAASYDQPYSQHYQEGVLDSSDKYHTFAREGLQWLQSF
jgi:hypothetical protein